jgi:seryl-tRNA synthetase
MLAEEMLDIKLIRENPEQVRANLKRRQEPEKLVLLDQVIEYDRKWREYVTRVNDLRRRRNEISAEIGSRIREGEDASALKREAAELPEKINDLEVKMNSYEEARNHALMRLPNLLHPSVPYGEDDSDNVVVSSWGKPPAFKFEAKSHTELVNELSIADFERGAKVSGAGFYYLRNELALLDYSIMRYAIDSLLSKGYALLEPPYMIRREPYEGVTDLSDFENVMYKIEGEDLYLIATSEHALASMFMDETILLAELPIRLCGVSPCFRREIGTHGRYTKGLFRVHQFNKVEQFIFSHPEESWELHEELQRNSEELYQELGIHYQVVNVCTGDIGSIAAKKYDIEAWMADGEYREVGSNSNCTDYQARRLNVKYRPKVGAPPEDYVHTLNNTALATSRTMIAIMEQCQQEDGTIIVPEALRKYMDGMDVIRGVMNPIKTE